MHRFGSLFAPLLGALVTLALLLAMRGLVVDGVPVEDAELRVHIADPTLPGVRREGAPAVSRPERVPDPLRPPRVVMPDAARFATAAAGVPDFGTLPAPQLHIEPGLPAGAADGDYVPIVRPQASYPRGAQERQISGYCVVEYTVTASGATRDAVAIDCQPPGEFEQASVRAALKFKYRPRIVDDRPVEVHGVRNRFVYELEQ